MKRSKALKIRLSIDELAQYCGFFSSESKVNNYYNCDNPSPPEKELDEELGREVGKCLRSGCPVATCEDIDDDIMTVFDDKVKRTIEDQK